MLEFDQYRESANNRCECLNKSAVTFSKCNIARSQLNSLAKFRNYTGIDRRVSGSILRSDFQDSWGGGVWRIFTGLKSFLISTLQYIFGERARSTAREVTHRPRRHEVNPERDRHGGYHYGLIYVFEDKPNLSLCR